MSDHSQPRPQHPGMWRALLGDVSRAKTIATVLGRHGFGGLAEILREGRGLDSEARAQLEQSGKDRRRTAVRVKNVLQDLGPTYVKVGQILSTRSDLLPPEMIEELTTLQDRVSPMTWDEVHAVLERELGSVDEYYDDFEQTPLASASIAQTHRARLKSGEQVVVKVQRPGLAATIRSDLDLMMVVARILESSFEDMKFVSPTEVVATLDDALNKELNFRHEASLLEEFGLNFRDNDDVVIPRVYRQCSTRSVLTMEFIDGRRPVDLVPGSDEAEKAALLLVDSFYRQVFVEGLFHGDPHPGNLFLVERDGRPQVAFIDLGLCGRLSSLQREYLVQLVVAVLSGDIDGISRMLLRMGHPMAPVNNSRFKLEIARIREKYFKKNLNNIELGAFIRECFQAAQDYRIRINAEYSVLSKAAVTIEGVIRHLSPTLDLHAHIKPYTLRLVQDFYSPERIVRGAVSGTVNLANFLREVPEQIGQVLIDLESGRLSVEVKNPAFSRVNTELNHQGTRLVLSVLCAGLMVGAPLWAQMPPTTVLPWTAVPLGSFVCAMSVVTSFILGVVAVLGHLNSGWKWQSPIGLSRVLKILRGEFR